MRCCTRWPAAAASASRRDHCTVGSPAEGLSHWPQRAVMSIMGASLAAQCSCAAVARTVGRGADAAVRPGSVAAPALVQHAAAAVFQQEGRDLDVEALAVLGHAEIVAVHGAA